MRISFTPTFERVVKKLHCNQKTDLDIAVQAVAVNPMIGEDKVGDIAGVSVCKFRMAKQHCLLAYRILSDDAVKLLAVGPHENFYRELKRSEKTMHR